MIIKVTMDESGYHAHVEGRGIEIARGLETLIEGILREDVFSECLLDKIVANAKDKIVANAKDSAREKVYTDTDSIKIKLSDDGHDKCMELIDDILEILERSRRRRDDD